MQITGLALRNNRTTIVFTLFLALYGLYAYFALPKAQDPGFTIRTAVITTVFPGATAERVEQLVTEKLEEKIQEMPELDNVTSVSRQGVSIINANFQEKYMNMRPIFDDLRRKIDQVNTSGVLPEGVHNSVVNDDFGDVYGFVYGLTGDGFSYRELKDYADEIRDQLLQDKQIAKVEIYGTQDEAIYVEYNNSRLSEIGMSPKQLANSLSALNILSSGGEIHLGQERISLQPTGNFDSVEELRKAIISLPSGNLVQLSDIASVYRTYQDPVENYVHVGDTAGLSIAISMLEGGNSSDLGATLRDLIPQIENTLPLGIQLKPVFIQSELVDANVSDFVINLLQAIGIVLAVMLVTLGLRTGLVVALLIPTTMMITLSVMLWMDIGIDQMSLAALIIALGLLVDNAIVTTESIMVRVEQGMKAFDAAIISGKELLMPLLISSLTTAATFMPIAFNESALAEYCGAIFYVVTIALLVSWLVSMTFIPLVASFVIKAPKVIIKESFNSSLYKVYRNTLTFFLKARILFLGLVAGAFYLAIIGLGYVPAVFIPDSVDPVLTIDLDLASGTDIEKTTEVVNDLERYINENWRVNEKRSDGVNRSVSYIGIGGPRYELNYNPPNSDPSNAVMILNLTDFPTTLLAKADLEEYLFENYPEVISQVKRKANGPGSAYPVQIRISGSDLLTLEKITTEIKRQLNNNPNVKQVIDDWGLRTKTLQINVDQQRALLAGVSSQDVATSLNASLSGTTLTEYREGDDSIKVIMRTFETERNNLAKLDGLAVYSSTNSNSVPLRQVADAELVWQPGFIKHRDRIRTVTVNASIKDSTTSADVFKAITPWIEKTSKQWPQGYHYEYGGDSESSSDAQEALAAKFPLAIGFIVILLVLQFNSLRRPLIILTTIPLGLIGVTIGLLAAKSVFGFFTILGVVSLAGIIINNAIVLLDRVKIEIVEMGRSNQLAVVHACQQRLRPILLTTATTVGGMIPLWTGGNPMFMPMAIAIIFGLIFATLLTLYVVPILYSLLFRVSFKGWEYNESELKA